MKSYSPHQSKYVTVTLKDQQQECYEEIRKGKKIYLWLLLPKYLGNTHRLYNLLMDQFTRGFPGVVDQFNFLVMSLH